MDIKLNLVNGTNFKLIQLVHFFKRLRNESRRVGFKRMVIENVGWDGNKV